ncbi:YfcC family protein, partial [Enterococcus faecalis]
MPEKKKKNKKQLSSFSILFIIFIVLGIVTVLLNGQPFTPREIDGKMGDHVVGAYLSDIIMAPY